MERKSSGSYLASLVGDSGDEDGLSGVQSHSSSYDQHQHHSSSPLLNQSPSKSAKRLLSRRANPFWTTVRNVLLGVVAVVNVIISIWIIFEHGNLPEMYPGEHENAKGILEGKKCHLPHLLPFSPEILAHLQVPTKIDCINSANSDFPGRLFFKTDVKGNLVRLQHPTIPCCYRPFYRISDGEVWIEPTKDRRYICHNITEPVTPIPPAHQYIEVLCDNGRQSYRDGFYLIFRRDEVDKRVKDLREKEKAQDPYGPTAERLSTIIIGLDSTSQMNFKRRMPKSLDLVKNTLQGIQLEGYVKVGENTLPNVVPLLTGLGLEEFKDECVEKYPSMDSAVHLDGCPFIWKYFKERSYVTSFSEDEVSTGVFNLHWSHAFLEPPTDHYFRPFAYRMVNAQNVYDGFCFGPRLGLQVLLDNLELTTIYGSKEDLLFHLMWGSKLAHDDQNRLGWGDTHLLNTLRLLHDSGTLNKSAVILIADHGSRNQEVRKTRQGQLEDRLPLAWIILPPWFSKKYPSAVKNLKANAKLITSAYDMHETLKDFADLRALNDPHTHYIRQRKLKVAEKKGYRRGTSLFTSLPEHRGCTSAGIPPHWCICYKKKKISIKSLDVHDATGFIIRQLNLQLRPHSSMCATLKLLKVISALKWHPEDAVEDTFNGNSEESYKKASLLQIQFVATGVQGQTSLIQAEFEVTVLFEPDHGWKFTEQVVRLDHFREHSECMHKQELKKLCLCVKHEEDELMDSLDTGHDFPVF